MIMRFVRRGFIMIELIIVIIIIGVLASLAMPGYFQTVEYSRALEAFSGMHAIRGSLERCYASSKSYVDCPLSQLDIEDPTTSIGTHFFYEVNLAPAGFVITANRNTVGGGRSGTIILEQDNIANTVTKSGTGPFQSIR